MTPFQQLFPLTGLSINEAAEWLDVNPVTVGRWKSAAKEVPMGVISQLQELVEAIKLVAEGHEIDLPYDSSYKMAEVRRLLLTEAMLNGTT